MTHTNEEGFVMFFNKLQEAMPEWELGWKFDTAGKISGTGRDMYLLDFKREDKQSGVGLAYSPVQFDMSEEINRDFVEWTLVSVPQEMNKVHEEYKKLHGHYEWEQEVDEESTEQQETADEAEETSEPEAAVN